MKKNKNFFISKAETLIKLKHKIKKSIILDIIKFTKKEWSNNKKKIIENIQNEIDKKIIIRSSAIDEDGVKQSQAGKYLSIKDVNPKNRKILVKSIDRVFSEYKKKSKLNEVLVQPLLTNVSASGVLFTYDNEQGTPYYSIEYDDLTGETDTVTAGKNDKSRTLYVLRSKVHTLKSDRFRKLISAAKEIENITGYPKLDIEFGIDKKNKIFIFQVRPLVIKKILDKKNSIYIQKKIKKLENYYQKKSQNKLFGKTSIYGVMPDWNPAEIIGILPKSLSRSFYEEIVTNKIWALSRKTLGYKDLSKYNLMENFASHPYINTNLSFFSFLPNKLNIKISKKIINFWIDDLAKNSFKHDKVEFDVCDTCFDFSTEKKIKKFKAILTKSEINIYRKHLLSLTQNMLTSNLRIIENSKRDLKILEFYRKGFIEKKNIDYKDLNKLIDKIKFLGTFNFANLARLAFVSESFLRSFQLNKIFSTKRLNVFKNSINTVLTNFISDNFKLQDKKITWKEFSTIYGHLRSGTYDIESKRYDQSKYFESKLKINKIKKNIEKFNLKNKEIILINRHLKKLKINFNASDFLKIIKENIVQREYSKFIFTKSVSDILEAILTKASKLNLTREDVAHLELKDIALFDNYSNKKKIIGKIEKNKKIYLRDRLIKLPYLITNKNDFSIIPLLKGVPNFITSKKITAKCINIKDKQKIKLGLLKNRIVLIESADPGFDWIFVYGISGLITKYGGSNSHMSIRCAEMNIPAVIGCGEQLFRKLKKSNLIEVDCNLSQIKILN